MFISASSRGAAAESRNEFRVLRERAHRESALHPSPGPVFGVHLGLHMHLQTPAGGGGYAAPLPGDPAISPPDGDHPRATGAHNPPTRGYAEHQAAGAPRSSADLALSQTVRITVQRY